MKIECTECKHEMNVHAVNLIDQKMTFQMIVKFPGEWPRAGLIGGVLTNTESLLLSMAKDAGFDDPHVFLLGIKTDDGQISMDFAVVKNYRHPEVEVPAMEGGGDG